MNLTRATVSMLTITDAAGTDPIRVITENYCPGKGRIIIQCWDRAWCAAWFAMGGGCTVEQFFAEADWGYILSNLTNGLHGMRKADAKRDEVYLRRIIEAVRAALRQEMAAAPERDLAGERDAAFALLRELLDKGVHDLAEPDAPEGTRSTGELEELQARVRALLGDAP